MRIPEVLLGVVIGFMLNAYLQMDFQDIGNWFQKIEIPNQEQIEQQ